MGSGNHLVHSTTGVQPLTPSQRARRDFAKRLAALTGAAGAPFYDIGLAAAEPRPETEKIRLLKIPALCLAPEYLAEDLLRLEGFSHVEYVELDRSTEIKMFTDDLTDIAPLALRAFTVAVLSFSRTNTYTRSAS